MNSDFVGMTAFLITTILFSTLALIFWQKLVQVKKQLNQQTKREYQEHNRVQNQQGNTNSSKPLSKLFLPFHLLSLSGVRLAEQVVHILPRKKHTNNQK